MIDGKLLIEKLLRYAVKFLHLSERDVIYFRNVLLREFKLDSPYSGDCDLDWIDELDGEVYPNPLPKDLKPEIW